MTQHRTYAGFRKPDGTTAVLVDGSRVLDPRLDLRHHSDGPFEWGYGESGPAQLALALLADHLGDDDKAVALYKHFKRRVVWKLPAAGWTLTSADIDASLGKLEAQTARERLSDLLGVAMKVACQKCGTRHTFWGHDRDAVLGHMDAAGWIESLAEDGEVRFTCPDCHRRI